MAYTVPTSLPSSLTAGMSWRWDETVPEFPPAEGWTLSRRFVGDSAQLELTAATSGSTYQFTATATQTATLPAGEYRVTAWVTSGATKYAVDDRVLTVEADPTVLAPGSQRSQAEADLVAVDAAIRAIVSGQVSSYSIGGRSFTLHSLGDLRAWRAQLAAQVWRERNPGQTGQRIAVSFVPTT